MTRRAPTYLRQPGDGEGLVPRQASIILHMGVVKAPLCNSGLSVSHLTERYCRANDAVTQQFLLPQCPRRGHLFASSQGHIKTGCRLESIDTTVDYVTQRRDIQ